MKSIKDILKILSNVRSKLGVKIVFGFIYHNLKFFMGKTKKVIDVACKVIIVTIKY